MQTDEINYYFCGNKIRKMNQNIEKQITDYLHPMDMSEKVTAINELRRHIHELSPFKNEPVDFVEWMPIGSIVANDYNPNKVAPPEMELLEVSIMNDGYTQPVVTYPYDGKIEVVDGFHRTRVCRESKIVQGRVHGYAPIVSIRKEQSGKNDRIASTIRHNRARGKHQVDAMSEIILELKNRNWKNERIARELGMDEDEILRLCQITGLQDIFKNDEFSKAWESSDTESSFEPITDDLTEEELEDYRTVNTSDPTRIFHTFDKWECHKAGFYASKKVGMTGEECERAYADFLSDSPRFEAALSGVITEWVNSCEHYLTNSAMNRIAWLGQAAMCYATGVPSKYCAGFNLMSQEQMDQANELALVYLNKWRDKYQMDALTIEEALSIGRQVNIY
jgi:ParB-like chromosome segregation protein Spo0J